MSYTINPNAKNKWARNAENTMDLSLETDASSVYLDNGRTLEQELGEGSMISNVATVDSAMSKVIDGTLDGVYESGVMYGRSLVNLCRDSWWNGTLTNSYDIAQQLKPNTKYIVLVNSVENIENISLATSKHSPIVYGEREGNTFKFITPSNTTELAKVRILLSQSPTSEPFYGALLLEYQEGMENWDIPYFTGLCDVKMPILRNLSSECSTLSDMENGTITGSNGANASNTEPRSRTKGKKKLNGASSILFSDNLLGVQKYLFSYDSNGSYLGRTPSNWGTENEIPVVEGAHYYRVAFAEHFENLPRSMHIVPKDHKTNILHTPETVTLRSLPNGVRDTFNTRTGVYTQRIKEIVFDGSNDEEWNVYTGDWILENSTVFCTYISGVKGYPWSRYTGKEAISDKIPSYPDNWLRLNDVLGMTNDNTVARKQFRIPKSYLETDNVDGFRKWLKQNPVTAYFELVTPITTTIEPLSIPFAYENGHIVLESGFEGQSLLPALEYSTVINRTGLIQSIANTVQKQEKQITKLEQMLIQNIINLDYNNTLLTLKNEMEEML